MLARFGVDVKVKNDGSGTGINGVPPLFETFSFLYALYAGVLEQLELAVDTLAKQSDLTALVGCDTVDSLPFEQQPSQLSISLVFDSNLFVRAFEKDSITICFALFRSF